MKFKPRIKMAKERTQKEIDEQIKWLTDNKPNLPPNTAFGDDNWAKIDAQIAVLKEALDEEEIHEKENSGEWDTNQGDGASDVLAWRDDGDEEAKPSEAWKSLLGRGKVDVLPPPSSLNIGGKPGGRVSVAKPNVASKPSKSTLKPKSKK